jgi:hypothetical protein
MNRQIRLKMLWVALCLLIFASNAGAQAKPDTLAFLKKQADTLGASLGQALAKQDSTLLMSLLSDTVAIKMPGDKIVMGRANVAKYVSLLFSTVGGGKLETTRLAIEKIVGYKYLARQAGLFTLTRPDTLGSGGKWQGEYSVYWRYTDSTWVIERLFVSKR